MGRKAVARRKQKIINDPRSIDYAFCLWLKPRLKYLLEHLHGHPTNISMEEWQGILQEMYNGIKNVHSFYDYTEHRKDVLNTVALFHTYFDDLWD